MNIIGPYIWRVFNAIARNYPEENVLENIQIETKKLFKEIGSLLPCYGCRMDYLNYLGNTNWNIVLQSRDSMIKFITDLHNHVNTRIRRPPWSNSSSREKILEPDNIQFKSLVEIIPISMCNLIKTFHEFILNIDLIIE